MWEHDFYTDGVRPAFEIESLTWREIIKDIFIVIGKLILLIIYFCASFVGLISILCLLKWLLN